MSTGTARAAALALVLGAAAAGASAGTVVLESPPQRVALLELFTSEGCSSCPPADRWLSGLVDDPRLWRRVVPVAFHVDYWDYLGWEDRFAAAAHAERQRRFAAEGRVRAVYTPGLVLNGREWRGWFRRRHLELADAAAAGRLRLEVDGPAVRVAFAPAARDARPLEAHLAWLGFGLETPVGAGENAGRTLAHDFVVLAHVRAPLAAAAGRHRAELDLPRSPVPGARRHALAAWVSAVGDQRPLQAVGGWVPARGAPE